MIEVQGLSKYYGERAAIRGLDFQIGRGEVIGFLGLNGAGKTTTLKILGCVLLPTSGRVTIDGFDVVEDPHEIRKRIGFLPDTPPLYDEMTVGGYLSFVARLRGFARGKTAARVREVEEQVGLTQVHEEVIGSLSHGYRQRVGLAQAVVHNPALLILDEPTSGLDPVQIVEMRALIRRLKGSHTILLSSHILSEISQTCDRLLVIQSGQIVAQGSEGELASRLQGLGQIEVELQGDAQRALEVIQSVSGVRSARVESAEGDRVFVRIEAPAQLRPEIARAVVSSGLALMRLDVGGEKLESIFLKLTHGKEQV